MEIQGVFTNFVGILSDPIFPAALPGRAGVPGCFYATGGS